jgi:choline dehydrogenase-like flavoprotein
MCVLHPLLTQLIGQVSGLPDRECHDGQRRVLGAAASELAAVRDEEIGNVVGLAVLVTNAVLRRLALHEEKARVVCVAGNSVETPRLLLNSESSKFPNGLANSSGQVGRNYMRHMTGTVYAIMPGRVNFDRGTQMAGIIKDESRHDPSRGFAGGYEMETLPGFGLAGVASNTIQGAWGLEYAKVIEMYDHFAGMWLVGEDLSQGGNGVTLHPTEKDQHGMPVPVVHFKDHANDIAMRNHRLQDRNGSLPIARRHAGVRAAAISQHAQHGHLSPERDGAGRRL